MPVVNPDVASLSTRRSGQQFVLISEVQVEGGSAHISTGCNSVTNMTEQTAQNTTGIVLHRALCMTPSCGW